MEPVVTLVIITWRSRELLRDCLRSVPQGARTTPLRIIVIDNASGDGTLEMLAAEFPDVVVVRNAENRGVAPARNQGLRMVESEFAMLLDTDTIVHEGAIDRLVAAVRSRPDVGIAGAKLILRDGSIQDSCKRFPTIITPILRRLDFLPMVRHNRYYRWQLMSDWDHNDTTEVDYLVGACQLIRTEVLKTVGELDDGIKYGPEDIDFCLRARRAGWKTLYVHDALVSHLYRRITRSFFSKVSWWHVLGLFRYFWKHRYMFSRPV